MKYLSNSLIKLENVSMFWDRRKILNDVNLSIYKNDFVAITGPNGGGKTTLLRIILKLLQPSSGTVSYFDKGQVVEDLHIGYLPQKNMIDSRFPISVREVVSSGLLSNKQLSRQEKDAKIADVIDLIGLEQLVNQPIGELSGGQLQRTLLGRAIISNPKILVLDEPLSYIDKKFEPQFYEIIKTVSDNTTIILVTHELSTIDRMANRHFIVDRNVHECTAAHHYVISTECN
jgi:zinc transport system ATP-binding protein